MADHPLLFAAIRAYALEFSDDKERPVGAAVRARKGGMVQGTNHYRKGETPAPDKSNIVHAEVAAIEAAHAAGFRLKDATIYTTKAPCSACAERIAEEGISVVVMAAPDPASRWYSEQCAAELYLQGIKRDGVRITMYRESELGDLIRDYEEYTNGRIEHADR